MATSTFARRWISLLLLTAGLAAGSTVGASSTDNFALRGFGTLGLTQNPSDEFTFIRDLTQPRGARNGTTLRTDSRLGLQLSYRHSDELDAVAQVLSRHTWDDSMTPRLNWAYLRYAPNPELRARLGRLSWDIFMLSDASDVGYSHVWIRPPVEYFGPQSLNFIDGADLEYRRQLGNGIAWAGLYLGVADEKAPTEPAGKLDLAGTTLFGGHLNYQIGDWWFRIGAGTAEFDNEADALVPLIDGLHSAGSPLADSIGFEGGRLIQYMAGMLFERGPWQAQLMLARGKTDTHAIANSYSGYALASYRLGALRPYIYFSGITGSTPSPHSGLAPDDPLELAVREVLAQVVRRQRTLAIGLRYDFQPNMALKLQAEHLQADNWRTAAATRVDPEWSGRGMIYSLALDFIF